MNNIKHKEGSVTLETEKESEIENDLIYCDDDDDDGDNLLYLDKKNLYIKGKVCDAK